MRLISEEHRAGRRRRRFISGPGPVVRETKPVGGAGLLARFADNSSFKGNRDTGPSRDSSREANVERRRAGRTETKKHAGTSKRLHLSTTWLLPAHERATRARPSSFDRGTWLLKLPSSIRKPSLTREPADGGSSRRYVSTKDNPRAPVPGKRQLSACPLRGPSLRGRPVLVGRGRPLAPGAPTSDTTRLLQAPRLTGEQACLGSWWSVKPGGVVRAARGRVRLRRYPPCPA